MNREEIRQELTLIFQKVLNRSDLRLEDPLSTDDIDEWDSLTNMTIISEIESRWNIHFKLHDIIRMRNIGDMIDTIIKKAN